MSSPAPVGAVVAITYDADPGQVVGRGDVLQTATGRSYVVVEGRLQQRGKRRGRYHLRVMVVDDVPAGATLHALVWNPREKAVPARGRGRRDAKPGSWTGPVEADLAGGVGDRLRRPVPGERWPYGPPSAHEVACYLHRRGLYCDCVASAADDVENGIAP